MNTQSKAEPQKCASCGAVIAPGSPENLCPACLLANVIGSQTDANDEDETLRVEESAKALASEIVGERIGRYKLLQKIGEGGCGIVYMAEQEEPVRRRVALKVIKLGMDTKAVIARFEAERQALAMMDHPNIAKVFDAGATDTGRPFFVMELVKGIRITDYCDQNKLSTRERLGLFKQVCHAIQHAHQKGIVHRDIKPSNILVTLHDGVPVPKVIDFGIAKATDQQLTDKTVFTAFGQFIGTPAYMSPEQAELSGLDIDTRTDIYSLGVLLYELLTGSTPFDTSELIKRGLDEIRRTIREVEPPRPSTKLSTLTDADLTAIAKARSTESLKLSKQLRGDLDWIVMKALEKDRTRRYETANDFAADITRHLTNEPVFAHAPSNLYKFRKFARRNKAALASATVITALLIAGVTVSAWQAVRATRAQKAMRVESSKHEQVATFLKEMLKGVQPSVALGRDTAMLREILDKTADRVGQDLKDQPEVQADLYETLGEAYRELGLFPKAEAMHREALRLRKSIFGAEHLSVAASLVELANVIHEENKLSEAEALAHESLALYKKLPGGENMGVVTSLEVLGIVLTKQGKPAEAESVYREALALGKKLSADEHAVPAMLGDNLAAVLSMQGKLAEAETMFRERWVAQQQTGSGPDPQTAQLLVNLGAVLLQQGKLAEGEELTRQALEMNRKLFGDQHPKVADSLGNFASLLDKHAKWSEAEKACREALAIRRQRLGDEHPEVAKTLHELGELLFKEGKLDEAVAVFRETIESRKKILGPEHSDVVDSLEHLGMVLLQQNKIAEAGTMLRAALAMQRKLHGHESIDVSGALNNLAVLLQAEGKLREADKTAREALAISQKVDKDHPFVAEQLTTLGWILLREGNSAEAESRFREVLALKKRRFGNEHPEVAQVMNNVGKVFQEEEKLAEAESMYRETLAMMRKLFGDDHLYAVNSLQLLASIFEQQDRLPEAEGALRDALAVQKRVYESEHINISGTLNDLAMVLEAEKKLDAAEAMYRESLAMSRKVQPEHPFVVNQRYNLATLLARQGKFTEAETMFRDALAQLRTPSADGKTNEVPRLGVVLHHVADSLREQNKLTEARALAEEAIAMYWRHPDWPENESEHAAKVAEAVLTAIANSPDKPKGMVYREGQGWVYVPRLEGPGWMRLRAKEQLEVAQSALDQKDYVTAGRAARRLIHQWPLSDYMLPAYYILGRSYQETGSDELVEPVTAIAADYQKMLAAREQRSPDNWQTFQARSAFGAFLMTQKKFAEAEPLLVSGYEGMKQRESKIPAGMKSYVKESLGRMVEFYEVTHRSSEAAEWKQKLATFEEAENKSGTPAQTSSK